ncbi:hypothetical protein LJ756_14825 [Arthrobacter sp. zg-Y411]|uniref:hypothetical protein n=1 Tax=Arthrobacter zhangbolii TaxID=2886936 RepID=UPI001D144D01|nr:hypothetical protein [Arthrobacter zhangbolii]MCC3295892.1 hypothetical protein [Arthrobacter zhangbolii]
MVTQSESSFDPARRFLNAYHQIERILRRQQGVGNDVGFARLVKNDNRLVRAQVEKLLDLTDLRNAIAHTPYSETDEPYANPREETVRWIEAQVDIIENPPKVLPALHLVPPTTLVSNDRLSTFLELVGNPHNYSQTPFRRTNGELGLITTNAVARWLASQYEHSQGYLADDVSVSEVADSGSESTDVMIIRGKKTRVADALNIFAGSSRTAPPAAILITDSGKNHEKPLGIVTPSDIPTMARILGI